MFVDGLVAIVYSLTAQALSLLPTEPGPPDLSGSLATMNAETGGLSLGWWFPVETLVICLTALVALWATSLVWRFLLWILVMMHIGGGNG